MSKSANRRDKDRYSTAQMLCALQALWPRIWGDNRPFGAETRIFEFVMGCDGWDEIDLADVSYALERRLGGAVGSYAAWERGSLGEWRRFWNAAHREQLTFGALADFLARRIPAVRVEPLWVWGRPCVPAGAFLAVRRVAADVDRRGADFGPSTPVRERFVGGKLRALWTRLRWISENRLPPLRDARRIPRAFPMLAAALLLGGGVAAKSALSGFALIASLGAALGVLVLLLVICRRFGERWDDPLPPGYRTFADVARAMARRPANATS